MIITREPETGIRENQVSTLDRPETTCWGSHLSSIRNLIELFGIIGTLLSKIYENGPNSDFCVDAFKYYLSMTSFDCPYLTFDEQCYESY